MTATAPIICNDWMFSLWDAERSVESLAPCELVKKQAEMRKLFILSTWYPTLLLERWKRTMMQIRTISAMIHSSLYAQETDQSFPYINAAVQHCTWLIQELLQTPRYQTKKVYLELSRQFPSASVTVGCKISVNKFLAHFAALTIFLKSLENKVQPNNSPSRIQSLLNSLGKR